MTKEDLKTGDDLRPEYKNRRKFPNWLATGIALTGMSAGTLLTDGCTINYAKGGKDPVALSVGSDVSDVKTNPNTGEANTSYPGTKPNMYYIRDGSYWGGWYTGSTWQYYRVGPAWPHGWHDVPRMNGPQGSFHVPLWR
jgi:hypothetical protein